jgi:hypothetical protein
MNKCTIHLLRKHTSSPDEDDVIRVFEDPDFSGSFRVTFRAAGLKKKSEFFMGRSGTLEYISTILKTLTYDTDPFQEIQVDTILHPSILYHVSDFDNVAIRHLVTDMIGDALGRTVEMVR